MKTYTGSQLVDPGIYFNRDQWAFRSMHEEGNLPGAPDDRYVRVPTLALMLLGPILGLAYVVFLPLAGFIMVGNVAAKFVWRSMNQAAEAMVRVLRPAWQPAHAFFTTNKQKKEHEPTPDVWAEKTAKELEDAPKPRADEEQTR